MINEILEYNREFVKTGKYKKYLTSKYPDKKLAILTCMDTRLTELLPAALGIRNGDAKIIKNAGGIITHPYGSVMRSLLIATVELGVTEIMVIGHTDCGVRGLDGKHMISELRKRGVLQSHINIIQHTGIHLEEWLSGFENDSESVLDTVNCLKTHPLMPRDVTINGFMMDSTTGRLYPIKE